MRVTQTDSCIAHEMEEKIGILKRRDLQNTKDTGYIEVSEESR